MKNVLILYSTKHGQTKKIARHIYERLLIEIGAQAVCHLQNLDDKIRDSDWPSTWDLVVIGAPIYGGRFPRKFRKAVRSWGRQLRSSMSAFFSVSLNAQSKSPQAARKGAQIHERFLIESGLRPSLQGQFSGALNYTKYIWPTKYLMRWISRKEGGPTDVSRDHELTDWRAVDEYVAQMVLMFRAQPKHSSIQLYEEPGRHFSMSEYGRLQIGTFGLLLFFAGLYFQSWWVIFLGISFLSAAILHAFFWYTILD